MIVLIILLMYPCSKKATTGKKIRAFMYIFGVTFFLLVVHKGVVTKALEREHVNDASEALMNGMNSQVATSDTVQINPKTGGENLFESHGV